MNTGTNNTHPQTPVKRVVFCWTCNKCPTGHVKSLKNVAMKSIYKSLLEILSLTIQTEKIDHIYICDTCIHTVEKIMLMRDLFRQNVELNKEHERNKRVIVHSTEPAVKKMKDHTYLITNAPKSRIKKQLFIHEKENEISQSEASCSDHTYISVNPELSVKDIYNEHKNKLLQSHHLSLTTQQSRMIQTSLDNLDINGILLHLLNMSPVKERLWQLFLLEISTEVDQISSTKTPSVLRSKIADLNPESFFPSIIHEIHKRCPRTLDFLLMMSCPQHLSMPEDFHVVPSIFAMAMYSRNRHLIALQKTIAAACVRYNSGNGLLGFLNKLGMCVPEKGKLPMLDELAQVNGKQVVEVLKRGASLKITVDNIDGRIRAYQVRIGSGNRDFHYTHWSVIVDRLQPIDLPNLGHEPKVLTPNGPDPSNYYLNNEEHTTIRNKFIWLIEKILVEEIPSFSSFDIPSVLDHKYRDIVDRPSQVFPMFVVMKDPKSLPNCVQIMDTIMKTLHSCYACAGKGEEFENSVTVPLGGDQLTRVTFDSARLLRAGAHTRTERLDQFAPIVEELFHVQQDLLEKIIKKFYTTDSSRQSGSLAQYRAVLHRINVNGQVKSNGYEAHKDFVNTVGRAMLVELAMETFGVDKKENMDQVLPPHIKSWSQKKKKSWLDNKVMTIVDVLFREFKAPKDVTMVIYHRGNRQTINIPVKYAGQTISLQINGELVQITVPVAVDGQDDTKHDEVFQYSISFLRVALEFILLNSVIKSGDIDMLTIILKRLIPHFVALSSYTSKYAIECINLLTKTEFLLSEYESVRVKIGMLVNNKGRPGGNKAADMQQENNIKLVKHVIRGLGANKTDKAMERSSKAAPVVSHLVNGLYENLKLKKASKHSKKSLEEDMNVLHDKMRALRPFCQEAGRLMPSCNSIPSNILSVIDKIKLNDFIKKHSSRAISKAVIEDDDQN